MADVTISNLPLGTPSGNALLPFSQSGVTYSARPSAFVAASSGSLLQIASNTLDTVVGPFTNSDGECLRVAITPKSDNSRMYVTTNLNWGSDNANGGFAIQKSVNNGSTWSAVSKGTVGGTLSPVRTVTGVFTYIDDYTDSLSNMTNTNHSLVDINNTTNPLIYRVYWYHLYQNGGSFFLNRAYQILGGNPSVVGSSTLTVQEIAG